MKFQITAAGLAAAFAASNHGPRVEITKFLVGSGYGYIPTVRTEALQGDLLYTGVPTGYRIIDANTSEFTLLMNEFVGTFEYGEIALIMPNGAVFAIGALQRPQYKVAAPNQDFNRFRVTVRLILTDAAPIIEWKVENLTVGIILEIPSVEDLINPVDADVNAYICHSPDENGNDPLATSSVNRWNISTHQRIKHRGVVTSMSEDGLSITSTDVQSAGLFPSGRYFIQFTSGIQQGTLRVLSGLDTFNARWLNPLSGVLPGDEFEILQSNISYSTDASDEAFFFGLLGRSHDH